MSRPFGFKHSAESRAKMSAATLGLKRSPASRAKISAAAKLRWSNPEARAKMSAICSTPEHRAQAATVHLGLRLSPEAKAKIGAANRGRHPSQETRIKLSLAHQGKNGMLGKHLSKEGLEKRKRQMARPDIREKMRMAMLGKHHSVASRIKMSIAGRGKRRSQETREKIRLAKLGPLNHFWRGGNTNEPYSPEWNGKLQEQIRNRDGHLCQMPDCYLPENGKNHDVHHIDYEKKNHAQVNLVTLCKRCHGKTSIGKRDFWTEYFQELQKMRGLI